MDKDKDTPPQGGSMEAQGESPSLTASTLIGVKHPQYNVMRADYLNQTINVLRSGMDKNAVKQELEQRFTSGVANGILSDALARIKNVSSGGKTKTEKLVVQKKSAPLLPPKKGTYEDRALTKRASGVSFAITNLRKYPQSELSIRASLRLKGFNAGVTNGINLDAKRALAAKKK